MCLSLREVGYISGLLIVCLLQERDSSVKKLKVLAKSSAEKASKERAAAAAQPLESSQRAVIRDLSLRVANLTRLNNQLKEERERAQVGVTPLCQLPSTRSPTAVCAIFQQLSFGPTTPHRGSVDFSLATTICPCQRSTRTCATKCTTTYQ